MAIGNPTAEGVYLPASPEDVASAGRKADLIDANGANIKIKKLPVAFVASSAEQDTGWDLPANSLVLDVFVQVTTVEATGTTKTIDVGLLSGESGGDADGFLDGVSVATTTGIKRGIPTITTGSNETFFASTTRGVLLSQFFAGTDVAADSGTYYEKPHIVGVAKSVTWTLGSNNFAEFVGNIFIVYVQLS